MRRIKFKHSSTLNRNRFEYKTLSTFTRIAHVPVRLLFCSRMQFAVSRSIGMDATGIWFLPYKLSTTIPLLPEEDAWQGERENITFSLYYNHFPKTTTYKYESTQLRVVIGKPEANYRCWYWTVKKTTVKRCIIVFDSTWGFGTLRFAHDL